MMNSIPSEPAGSGAPETPASTPTPKAMKSTNLPGGSPSSSEQTEALGAEPTETEAPAEEVVEETPSAAPWDDEAEFEIDGETIKAKELREGRLRQEDYTRKTQALAEARRKLEGELSETKEQVEDLVEWAQSLNDPETAVFELQRNFPDTFQALRDYFISEALEEQEMSPAELAWKRRAEKAEIERKAREADEAFEGKKANKRAESTKVSDLRKNFNTWADTNLTAAGLDAKSEDHQQLIRGYIMAKFQGQTWTEEHFKKAAVAIAKQLGKTAPKPEEKKLTPKPGVEKLPPVKSQGNKAPPGPKNKEPKPKRDSEEHFKALREKYGVA